MIEFGIENFKPFEEFSTQKCAVGTKPCLIFHGEPFQQDPLLHRFKNLLIDFFRGTEVEMLRLQGLEHVWSFTADPEGRRIFARSYRILLKKSGSRTPRVELAEMGPRFDMTVRRSKLASDDLFKVACKQPPELKTKKQKNVSMDVFGTKVARIHLGRQHLRKIQTRKVKALQRNEDRTLKGNEDRAEPSTKKKRTVEELQE